MSASVTHAKVSAKSDGGDSSLVLPSDWNAGHTISGVVVEVGRPTMVLPQGTPLVYATTNNAASQANAIPIYIPMRMKVRSLMCNINTSNSGSIQWGVFDLSASSTAATKVAGGSAAPGGTGWRAIAATSAPVTVAPGWYMLITLNPSANSPTWQAAALADAAPWNHYQSSYTWSDTPNFTTGWGSGNTTFRVCYLEGDLDDSANSWH